MEEIMFSRFPARLAVLALLAVVIPGCGKNKVSVPNVVAVSPAFTATNVPHWPLIILQFDSDMDAATINTTNVRLLNNANLTPFGGGWTVTYRPGARQAIITPGAFLTESIVWDVTCTPGVKDTEGTSLAGSDVGEIIENQFTTTADVTPATRIRPSFGQPSAGTTVGTSGSVTLAWTQATESAAPMAGSYDIYFSTGAGAVDLLNTNASNFVSVAAGASNPTGVDVTGLAAGVAYFFIVVAHDNNGNVLLTGEITAVAGP
jgi:hypothetical protein